MGVFYRHIFVTSIKKAYQSFLLRAVQEEDQTFQGT